MKISKLFHWLYATLMFLPILMFLPSCLYYSLNKYATNETTTEINYKYQSNQVNTLDDLVLGNIYKVNNLNIDYEFSEDFEIYFKLIQCESFNFGSNEIGVNDWDIYNYLNNSNNYIEMQINTESINLTFVEGNAYLQTYFILDSTQDYGSFIELGNIVFIYENLDFVNYLYADGYVPEFTDYNVIESVETNVQDTISNKLFNAWESIWNLPLFSWTKNSFVSAPFTYITGLFGLSSTNSLNYVFTYFCSISICWLVFDLLMYVPNLAHRWLDKGAIE